MKKITIGFLTFILTVFALLSVLTFCVCADGESRPIEDGNRIYFYNIGGNGATSGDLIIVESEGHFGLIDAGHTYNSTIVDGQGKKYSIPSEDSLSSQVEFKNGRDAADYMINTLGIRHLDFVLATHSHSDHIGGLPDIASFEAFDGEGNPIKLCDSDTVYFYKNYRYINNRQDDLKSDDAVVDPGVDDIVESDNVITNSSWHNQAFFYQALRSMRMNGCVLAELSELNFTAEDINNTSGIGNFVFSQGDTADILDDYLSFDFGSLCIRLYNLYSHQTSLNENVNSVIAVVSDGVSKFVSLSDINVENRVEQKLAKNISKDIGTADMIKISHHGTNDGSNSREMLDCLQPKYAVVTRKRDYAYGSNARGAFSAAMVYARTYFNTVFYEAGASDFALVASFTPNGFVFNNLEGVYDEVRLTSDEKCISTVTPYNGWSDWSVEWGENNIYEHFYIYYGKFRANWYKDEDDKYYYIDENAKYITDWKEIDGVYYYFSPEATDKYNKYEMYTGWNDIGDERYYFDQKGRMYTGWNEFEDGWYYFKSSGALVTGWKKLGDNWYYFNEQGRMLTGPSYINGYYYMLNENGIMKIGWTFYKDKYYYSDSKGRLYSGWKRISSQWYHFSKTGYADTGIKNLGKNTYYFSAEGVMQTGWQNINGKWYRFNSSGQMLKGWQQISKKWYFFNSDGTMKTGWKKSGGKWYYFGSDGIMKTGWQKINKKWYFFNESGAMLTGWQKLEKKWYYFNSSGEMLTGKQKIGKKTYTFDSKGVWIK